jgi:exonuclease SbcC
MIPLQLTLKNFLSYREATLDFRGLHTACICGVNGAGKSSLLEAITWVIWGACRAASEDDVIHIGAEAVRVDFQFIINHQTYRIIRSRQRGRSSSLEFQIKDTNEFRSLSGKGLRATQEQITIDLKLDYDTFINSAYLRQGRADEFMLRRPNERKQILVDLLKLDRYEILSNRAKDLSKQFKGQTEQLELSLKSLEEELAQREAILQEKTILETELEKLQIIQEKDRNTLLQLQRVEHQRQNWQQQLVAQQTQYQNLDQDCDRLKQEEFSLKAQLVELQNLLNQELEVMAGYDQYLQLQREEETLSTKFQAYQDAQQQKQRLEQQLVQQSNELNLQRQQAQTRLEFLQQQEQEIQQILNQASEVQAALEELHKHRQHLHELDQLQQKVSPFLQRRYALQTEIERVEAQLKARLEQLKVSMRQLSAQIAQVPNMRQAILTVNQEIEALEKKQVYQQRVHEKGSERKNFQQRLQENQQVYQQQWEELQQKLELLETPEASCPLCEQELDEKHRHQVVQKTQTQQTTIQDQIWVIREQIAVCDRELQILRTEYAQLTKELAVYASRQHQLGQLEAQLTATDEVHAQLQQTNTEIQLLERSLASGDFAPELNSELQTLERELQTLNYDEKTHALVRGEVERWRWAEIKQARIEEATRRQTAINNQKPKFLERISSLKNELEQLHKNSDIQQKIKQLEQYILDLGYERLQHNQLLTSLRQAAIWQFRYQELQQAQQQFPKVQLKLQQLEQLLQVRLADRQAMQEQIESLASQRQQFTDKREEIHLVEQHIQQQRQQLDLLLAQQGRLDQSLFQLDSLQTQYEKTGKQLKEFAKQYRVYQELSQAFGKNGIQALMIENVLPQLEAETNQILARLTGNQLHVQFLTQKSGRGGTKKQAAKLIDTLDILIADDRGTRPYETYSGGEAFRINFSIRLALARLLAQRAGTSLQMLIVDEGFGTQDTEGCDRLIAAINAIAADFSCILTVTHMPQFKEAFQHRIEVYKTSQGSQLKLSM